MDTQVCLHNSNSGAMIFSTGNEKNPSLLIIPSKSEPEHRFLFKILANLTNATNC